MKKCKYIFYALKEVGNNYNNYFKRKKPPIFKQKLNVNEF